MAYTPTIWKDGDLITADKMNKLEQGLANIQSGGSSGSGVSSFNARTGDVKPKTGDYTAAMVGAATLEQVTAAIQAAILDSWKGSY